MKRFTFENKKVAKRAGRKGGKNVPPWSRYFSINREAAAAAGRKSRYVAPKPPPVYDDTQAIALFVSTSPDYAQLVPWDNLAESTRQFWRKQAKVVPKNDVDAPAEVDLLGNPGNLGQGA